MNQYFVNELKASFLLRKPKSRKPTGIYLSVYLAKKQYKFSLKVKVYPDQWSNKKKKAFISNILSELDNSNNRIVNEKIDEYSERFNCFKSYLCNYPNEVHREAIILNRFFKNNMKKVWKNEENPFRWMTTDIYNRVKPTSATNMTKVITDFEDYCKTKEIYTLESINLNFIEEYREKLKSSPGKRKNTLITINAVNNKMSILIGALKNAARHDFFDYNTSNLALYKPLKEKVNQNENQISLTLEEVKRIMELELIDTYKEVRDAFIFQCFTGQRYGDIKKFNDTFIRTKKNGKEFLQFVQEKRTRPVYIEVLPPIIELINNNPINYRSPATANDYIKKIAKLAGISGQHPYNIHTKNGIETINIDRYNLIGTHTARRFFITWARGNKVPDNIIMKITGLKDKDMLEKYDKLSNENAAIEAGTILTESLKKEGIIKDDIKSKIITDNSQQNIHEVIRIAQENVILKQKNEQLDKTKKVLMQHNTLLKYEVERIKYDEYIESGEPDIPTKNDFFAQTTDGDDISIKEAEKQIRNKIEED